MTAYDIISRKKMGCELSSEEISFFVRRYTEGDIPDYQASALLMAICLRGMSDRECADLTYAIESSGDVVDLSPFGDLTVDKHSTGGVGDKTTLITAPLAASVGCVVAKMSGRGLGHTGGTIDKLESIPGYKTSLSPDEFAEQIAKIGIAVIGQTGNLAPADKKLYALRDVTATVDSLPLITSSIMGKKLAAGSKSIVLDVKCGSGSFMKTPKDARSLAEAMVRIGHLRGRRVRAIITDMDKPLGNSVGNALEVREAIDVLRGAGPRDLREISITLAAEMLSLSAKMPRDEAVAACKEALRSGLAFEKFRRWITAQGGDPSIFSPDWECAAPLRRELLARRDGYITRINTEQVGLSSVALGAGRARKDDEIDYGAGIIFEKTRGDFVRSGDIIAYMFSSNADKLNAGAGMLDSAIEIGDEPPTSIPLIYDTVG